VRLTEILPAVMEPKRHELLSAYVAENLDEFKDVLAHCPIKNQIGAVSTGEAFWLYCLVRDLSPKVIIESGTLYGFSLWFLEAAVQGQSEIHSFDPGEYEVEGKSEHVQYHKIDWTGYFPPAGASVTDRFVFFDDHIHQGRRLAEAKERGVRHMVFHDNYESLKHSHYPLRYCMLGEDVEFMHTFECLRADVDPIFAVGENAQTYRWLTWVKLEG
jgi:hypothetical protein